MCYLWRVFKFTKHHLQATSIHGAHSPFLFELFNEVFNIPFHKVDKKLFKTYRKKRVTDKTPILFEEFGAGKNHNRTLTIGQIACKSAINQKEAKLLINLTRYLKPNHILELGTSTGVSTKALKTGAPHAHITTIEGCSNLSDYIKGDWEESNTEFIASTFDQYFDKIKNDEKKWDLIYIDGNHTFEATIKYYETLKNRHIHDKTCIIFDDIYWSKEMLKAWQEITNDTSNSLTLDLYNLGVVFFSHKLTKQHFKINI